MWLSHKKWKPFKATGGIWALVLSKHPIKQVRRSCSQLGSSKRLRLRRGFIERPHHRNILRLFLDSAPEPRGCERCVNMPLPGKCHTSTATSSVEFSPSLRNKVRTTPSPELNMCTLIRIPSISKVCVRVCLWNARILKPTAVKLEGWSTAVSRSRLPDRWEWRMHLIGGQLSSRNSIAMATAKRLRTRTASGLVSYCVIFTGTYIAHAATQKWCCFSVFW